MDLAEGQASNRLEALDDDAFERAFADIMAKAREMGLKGFGGGCFATAVVINRVIFGGAGTLAVGLNAPLWENASHALGQAAVLARCLLGCRRPSEKRCGGGKLGHARSGGFRLRWDLRGARPRLVGRSGLRRGYLGIRRRSRVPGYP